MKFFKKVKDWTLKTIAHIGNGFRSTLRFLWKHKFSVLFLSVFGVAAGVLLGNIIAGTFVLGIVVEALAIGLVIGAVELLLFGGIIAREKRLKNKELKLAKNIQKYNAQEELGNTISDKKKYRMLKKLNKVRYKLARASINRTGKPMSLFEGRRFTSSTKEKKLADKKAFLQAKADMFQTDGVESSYKNFRYRALESGRLNRVKNRLNQVAPIKPTNAYQWTKTVKAPIGGFDDLKVEKTQINCHKLETMEAFKKFAREDVLSHKAEKYIELDYNDESQVMSTSARFVDRSFKRDTSLLLLKEAKQVAEEEGNIVFPIKFTSIDSKEKGKNISIKNMEQLDSFIEKLEFAKVPAKKVKASDVIEVDPSSTLM